jgi:EmrB/QacA subfamily drug resistance transporter
VYDNPTSVRVKEAATTTERPNPMTREQIHTRRWAILGVLILALFGVTLDNTILNIALPTLASDLDATASQLQWLVDAYVLVFAGLLLVAGALSDRYGRRLMLVIGLTVFGIGSALAPFVQTADQLILLRAFMGLGAALTMPSTLSIIGDVFEADERPKAIALWSSVSGLGIIAGPLLGGWLLEHFAWGSVFAVNVPFVALGIIATLLVVPESQASERVPLDPIGGTLSVAGLVALVYGIIEIPASGWTDPIVLGSLGAAAVLLGLFLAWERRIEHPMLDVRLFANPRFTGASLSVALVFFSLMGALFFLTQYFQGVQGLSPFETGLRFIPIALGVIIVSPISAQLLPRLGVRFVTAAGLAVTAVGMAMLAAVGIGTSDLYIALVLVVLAGGIALAMTPATDAIMGALPPDQFGVGSAVNDTTRELGGAFGVAVLGSAFAASYAAAMRPVTEGLPAEAAAAARDSLAAAAEIAARVGGDAGATLLASAQQAFVDAMSLTSLFGVGFAIAGTLVALVWLPARSSESATEVTADVVATGRQLPDGATRALEAGAAG